MGTGFADAQTAQLYFATAPQTMQNFTGASALGPQTISMYEVSRAESFASSAKRRYRSSVSNLLPMRSAVSSFLPDFFCVSAVKDGAA